MQTSIWQLHPKQENDVQADCRR